MSRRTGVVGLVAVLALCRPAHAFVELRQGFVYDDGVQVILRGAMYWQPHAYHHCFWSEMDPGMLEGDFRAMKSESFNTVILSVDWGAFMPSVDVAGRKYEWSKDAQGKLLAALDAARAQHLYVILWFGWSRLPEGVGGKLNEAETDAGGKAHPAFYGYLLPSFPGLVAQGSYAWEACLEFHERVAKLTQGYENVLFDPLDWQHLSMNYWAWGEPANLAAWRARLQQRDPDLQHWNELWEEHNATWDDVLFPVDDWVKRTAGMPAGSPYAGLPAVPYNTPKWDAFNEWHDGLFIRICKEIVAALKRGNPRPLIGQRIDFWHYGHYRVSTWGPEGVDFLFHGYYPDTTDDEEHAYDKITETITKVRQLDPKGLPILLWETGIDLHRLYPNAEAAERERQQAHHMNEVIDATEDLGLMGFGWWVWRDYYMSPEFMNYGVVATDGREKPAAVLMQGKWAVEER
jgi:hypothetical protein